MKIPYLIVGNRWGYRVIFDLVVRVPYSILEFRFLDFQRYFNDYFGPLRCLKLLRDHHWGEFQTVVSSTVICRPLNS